MTEAANTLHFNKESGHQTENGGSCDEKAPPPEIGLKTNLLNENPEYILHTLLIIAQLVAIHELINDNGDSIQKATTFLRFRILVTV